MSTLPDGRAWHALQSARATAEDAELVPGAQECLEFDAARAAFDVCLPASQLRMIAAFQRFHQLGFQAFFQGSAAVPMAIACRPELADMWMDGFLAARMSALARHCDCDCPRHYRWGQGYDACPRRCLALAQKKAYLAITLGT